MNEAIAATDQFRIMLAHQVVREWHPPGGLGLRGHRAWETWALEQAEQAVRDGRIAGEMPADGGCGGLTITRGMTEPPVPDALFEEWRALGGPSQLFVVR